MRNAILELRPGIIYHCAGAAHVGESWSRTVPTFAINVRGTHHLLEALREATPSSLESRFGIGPGRFAAAGGRA